MRHESKKISKIIDEILTYFLVHFKAKSEISVVPGAGHCLIGFRFTGVEMSDEQFEALRKRLVVKRKLELEEYYWQLAGEIEDGNELNLVGMMCDSISIKKNKNTLTLDLVRNTGS